MAFTRAAGGTADVWLHDIATGETTQVTIDPDYDETPFWSPDGRAIVHQGRIGGQMAVVVTTIDGSQPQRAVVTGPEAGRARFMPNRPSVLISRPTAKGGYDLGLVPLDRPDAVQALTSDPDANGQPAPSPDGQWVAFVSARTGRSEVVLSRLIDDGAAVRLSGQRLAVSSAGGVDPEWRADGREILYLAPDRTLMAVSVSITGSAVVLGRPAPLFRLPADAGGSNWSGNADHSKFVVVDAPQGKSQTFRVMTNWWR